MDREWKRSDLEQLINDGTQENLMLEYKGAGALNKSSTKEITKDVSAFANSVGGRQIYGIKSYLDEDKRHLPERIEPIDARQFSQEWLDQIISQIQPKLDARIHVVSAGPEIWHVCYVIEIAQGQTAHQATDLKYYRRSNARAEPMQDYEIRLLMNRSIRPQLEFAIQLRPDTVNHILNISTKVTNSGKCIPSSYAVHFLVPTQLGGLFVFQQDGHVFEENGKYFHDVFAIGNAPLFPDGHVFLNEVRLGCKTIMEGWQSSSSPQPSGDTLIATLYADQMTPIRKAIPRDKVFGRWL